MLAAEKKVIDGMEMMLTGYEEVVAHIRQLYEKIGAFKVVVSVLKEENAALKAENARLRQEMSYMKSPNEIGDRHEMGSW